METRQRYFLPSVLKMMKKDNFLPPACGTKLILSRLLFIINPLNVIILGECPVANKKERGGKEGH